MRLGKLGMASLATMLAIGIAGTVGAQVDVPLSGAHPPSMARAAERPTAVNPLRLPADSVTHHTMALTGRTLAFTATAGAIKLRDGKSGGELADIAYIAYRLDHGDAATRPVTFVFNGGPGASSAWLQLGALGPWRLRLDNGTIYPSSAPVTVDNDETWLDFTDLVFVDPPGTGYSDILAGEEARKQFWSVRGDIEALAVFVRRWLTENDRLASPKFIVGESYGGFRGPRLAEALAGDQGVGISGLILISPVLDMGAMSSPNDALYWAARLPSYAAAARERSGPVTRAELADVETYAGGDYLLDFMRGPRDMAAVARMSEQVTKFTGLDPALVRRMHGRIDKDTFLREFDRAHGKIGAFYDVTIAAYDPAPESAHDLSLDPIVKGFIAPMTSAMLDIYRQRLGWKIDHRYELLSDEVGGAWEWGQDRRRLNVIPTLKEQLALDPNFRVLVAQGLTDVQVPYFGTKLLLDQIPDYGPPGRVAFKLYGGGHMLYTRDASRQALRADARNLIEGK